jgi:uncharacterized small protein (DUF1192 family)
VKKLTRMQVLEKQNKDLRTRIENMQIKYELAGNDKNEQMLQAEICRLNRELEKARDLREETIQAIVDAKVAAAVAAAEAPLLEELNKANLEIARLKAQINKDSSNSSKPSSTNGFKRVPTNSREKSNKPKGGQLGHPGHRLGLPENMDKLIEDGRLQFQIIDHTDGAEEYISRYVLDVEVITTVTEYRYAPGTTLPKNQYNEVSYGESIKAMSVFLLVEGIIAEDRLSDMICGLTSGAITISPATLERYKSQLADKLESSGELDAIREDLLNCEVMHTDDTTICTSQSVEYQEDGTRLLLEKESSSYRATIRNHSNENSTLYTVNPGKGMDGIERDGILTQFHGVLSHDHESKFYNYGSKNSTCGVHLLRDLKGLRDLERISWAGAMRAFIAQMNGYKNKDLAAEIKECGPDKLKHFEQEYDELIIRGRMELAEMAVGSFGYDEFRKMLNRLTDYKDNYMLFIRDYKAPFSNNLSERDLRPEKTKEKVSVLFRSWSGLETHVRIRSFLSTLKKRGEDLHRGITRVNMGLPVLRQ